MRDNFPKALQLVLKHEGGFVNHPRDPGGATNMGITHITLSDWRGARVTPEDVKALELPEVSDIYRAKYWENVRGDGLPSGVDFAVFDYAVNSGVSRAGKALQRELGVAVDGIIGPMTLRALANQSEATIIDGVCDQRQSFLERLSTFDTFGRGWTRRVAETRAAAHEMARGVVA